MTTEHDVTRQVLEQVDLLAERMVSSLADAIAIPSVNPRYPGQEYEKIVGAEGDVSALLGNLYAEAGAEVTKVTVERGRDNACGVVPGTGGGRSLLLNGHVDVVPPGRLDRWRGDPFRAQVTDDAVIGRGATDMKGGLVAAAYAALALRRAGVRLAGDLVLQGVVGEEVGDHEAGTTAVLEAGFGADAAIVCEPSGQAGTLPASVPVTPGLLWFSISLEGKTAHSGLRGMTVHPTLEGDALGVNTVDKFWVIYQALRALEDDWAGTTGTRSSHPATSTCCPACCAPTLRGSWCPSSSPTSWSWSTASTTTPTGPTRRSWPRSSPGSWTPAAPTRGCVSTRRCSSGSCSGRRTRCPRAPR